MEASMAVKITGGEQLITSDMQRTFRDATAAAKKQLQETGTLQGFAKEFTATSAQGEVTIEISAIASALYEKGADGDDYLLAWKVTDKEIISDGGVGISSGSSGTIDSAAEVDSFTESAVQTFSTLHWASYLEGTPEEIEAYNAAEQAKLLAQPGNVLLQATGSNAAPAAPAKAEADKAEPNSKLQQAQAQAESANQLAAKLSSFLDDLKDQPAPKDDDKSPVQSALRKLLTRADLSV
jgi:hypothetical protein